MEAEVLVDGEHYTRPVVPQAAPRKSHIDIHFMYIIDMSYEQRYL